MLGVTSEAKKDTETWVRGKGAEYAYAYDKGGKLKRRLDVGGIPHAVLLDPRGRIVWEGHPATLENGTIEKALKGALQKPLYELPANASAVRTALSKRAHAAALSEAAKLAPPEAATEIQRSIRSLVECSVAVMKGALAEGDFLTAHEAATDLEKDLDGLPESQEAKSVLADLAANQDAQPVMAAQKKVRAILDQKLGKRRDYDKAVAELKKIMEERRGSFAFQEAERALLTIGKRRDAIR